MQQSTDLAAPIPKNFQTVWRINDVDIHIVIVNGKTFVNGDCVHDAAVLTRPDHQPSKHVA